METITSKCVLLNAQAPDKTTAIRLAGQLLVEAGYIEPGYVDSLLKREQVANTLLGATVAIPHGMVDDRHLIRRTGVAVVQIRKGVSWKDGEPARLIVAIAAQSDEHIALLRRLTRLMQRPESIEMLVETDDPELIVSALADVPAAPAFPAPVALPWPADAEATWTLDYPNGLHARPATRWTEVAKRFASEIRIVKGLELSLIHI